MKTHRPRITAGSSGPRAFTRVELCACLAAGALLLTLTLPALATSQSRGHVAQCLNNLRLMGRAVQMWASDYTGQPPWRTLQSDGGLKPSSGSRPGNAWFDYLSMSNQLGTPRILACPADQGVLIASDFSRDNGGYFSVPYRANATSYSLNLESVSEQPQVFLFGDLNLKLINSAAFCQTLVNNALTFSTFPFDNYHVWTNRVHGFTGNIVTMDGGVATTSSEQMRAALRREDDNGSAHLLKAR